MDRQVKNEKGFTLIEMLLAMSLGLVILGAAIYTYTQQDQIIRNENTNLQLRDRARLAMDSMVPNIRQAGAGFPPGDSTLTPTRPAVAITTATATQLVFGANTDSITTVVSLDSTTITSTGLATATDPLAPAIGFVADDNIVFFDVGTPTSWNTRKFERVLGTGPYIMDWMVGPPSAWPGATTGGSDQDNNFAFTPVTTGIATTINNYHVITYTYNAGAQTITYTDDGGSDDGGTDDTNLIIATNVSNLTFSYFDNAIPPNPTAVLGDIRKITVSITVADPANNNVTSNLLTDIHLRNMGI